LIHIKLYFLFIFSAPRNGKESNWSIKQFSRDGIVIETESWGNFLWLFDSDHIIPDQIRFLFFLLTNMLFMILELCCVCNAHKKIMYFGKFTQNYIQIDKIQVALSNKIGHKFLRMWNIHRNVCLVMANTKDIHKFKEFMEAC
jgi:hypothetical protein